LRLGRIIAAATVGPGTVAALECEILDTKDFMYMIEWDAMLGIIGIALAVKECGGV